MTGADQPQYDGVRFGRTVIFAMLGELTAQSVDALVVSANSRGIMGAGMIGAVRVAAGPEVERAAMSQAPLTLGAAIATEPGMLSERGVRTIIHAVVSPSLGDPVREEVGRRAIAAALRIVEERRYRSVALPLIGSGTGPGHIGPEVAVVLLVEEIVAHLRRTSIRIDRIVLASRSANDVEIMREALDLAREHTWGQSA